MRVAVVLADANILYSRTLRDYFVYVADAGAMEIRWSEQILDEMSRNLQTNLGLTVEDTSRLAYLMNDYIDYALIDVDSDALAAVAEVDMDCKDRHVLAAAISADSDILLTQNARHFPRQWMLDHDIELLTPGELLNRLARKHPDRVQAAHEMTVRYSHKSEADVLTTLETIVGNDATDAVRLLLASIDEHPEDDAEV